MREQFCKRSISSEASLFQILKLIRHFAPDSSATFSNWQVLLLLSAWTGGRVIPLFDYQIM